MICDYSVPVLDYWRTKYDAFRLNTTSEKASSFFEAVIIIDGVQYRYGESTLTPLTDFSSDMRSNLENLYLDGDFGGVPYVSMSGLMELIQREEK